MKFIVLLFFVFLNSCSHIEKFNAVEGKIMYEEHYSTFNDIDYESGESQTYGFSITNKVERAKNLKFDYSFFPDVSFEQSKLVTSNLANRTAYPEIEMTRISAFFSGRVSMLSMFGNFELDLGVGPSYIEAYNDTIDTSQVELTFRYEGIYTLYLLEKLYLAVSFTFQESPESTYSEYYSLMYKLGYLF